MKAHCRFLSNSSLFGRGEARAFPLRTLVLALARSRHIRQVYLRPKVIGTYLLIILHGLAAHFFVYRAELLLLSFVGILQYSAKLQLLRNQIIFVKCLSSILIIIWHFGCT